MPPARVAILAGLATALLAGCASYHPAPISPAQTAAAIEARSLDDARLGTFIAAELGRTDPAPSQAPAWDLARLTLAALYYHPDLDIARARLAAARAAAVTAGERPNPTLGLTAAFGASAVAGAIPAGAAPLTIGPVVDFVIETFGKREYRTAEARHRAAAARQELATAAWQVRGHVRDALIDLWVARGHLSLLRRRLTLQEELVGLLESRRAAGATSALDVERERVARAQLALAVRDAERASIDARARLATAVGIPLAALDGVVLSFDALDHPAAAPAAIAEGALRRRALTGRSDVRAALASYAAAQSALQLAIAGQYPNLTLGPGYQYDFGLDKYMLGPALVLPIFNHNEGPIAEAVARRRLAAATFTALEAAIIGAIDRAAADYAASSAAVATAETLMADARGREGQMRRSFAAGAIDRPSLVAAELEEAAAELSRFDAVARQRRALAGVEDALRQPLFDRAAAFLVPDTSPRRPAEPPR